MSNRSWEEKVRAELEKTPLWLFQKTEEQQAKVLEISVMEDDTEWGTLLNE